MVCPTLSVADQNKQACFAKKMLVSTNINNEINGTEPGGGIEKHS